MFVPHPDTIHQLSMLRHGALLAEADRQRALKPVRHETGTVAAPPATPPQASAPQPALPGRGVAGEASL